MKRVIVESPYAGDVEKNLVYLRACLRDCLLRGEAPFASHGLYTQQGVLDDNQADHRSLGIRAGSAWHEAADVVAVYKDHGISGGMEEGIESAKKLGIPVVYRTLPDYDPNPRHDCVYSEFVRAEMRDNEEFTVVGCPKCHKELAFQSLAHARPSEDT